MGKTLNELAGELKTCIIDLQSDAHNKGNMRKERYNNLKLVMDAAANPKPHVIITIAMSEAEFDLQSGDKTSGGLGPDERYVLRWFDKSNTISDLRACWMDAEKNKDKKDATKE